MANAMSTSKPKAYKRLLFVVLLMPHAPQKSVYLYGWYIMRIDKRQHVLSSLYRELLQNLALQRKIITNPIQLAGAEMEDNG